MFCGKCGAQLPEDVAFCTNCGAPIKAQQAQYTQPVQPQQPRYQQPTYQPQPQPQPQPVYQNPIQAQTELPMKWFHFLIYFALFAGALINFGQGIMMMNGMQYGDMKNRVYKVFEGLETLDLFIGIALVCIAVLQIYTRFALAGFRKNAPNLVNGVYLSVAATNLLYTIIAFTIISEETNIDVDMSSNFANFALNLAIMACNTTYFKKRAHLFTK